MAKDSFNLLANYIDLLLDAICVVDSEGRFEFVSAGAERIFGYTPDEMLGRQMLELVHPDDKLRTLQTANEINAGAVKVDFENRYIRKDGRIVHLLWSARWSAADRRRVAVARDITRSKQAELRQNALYTISETAFASENLPDLYRSVHQIIAGLMPMRRFAILLQDNNGQLRSAYNCTDNKLVSAASEADISQLCEVVMQRAESILITNSNTDQLPPRARAIADGKHLNWLGVALKSHSSVIGALLVQNDADALGYSHSEMELLEFVSVQVVVAIERKQMLERLQRSALYDQLTQLPNRELFYDRLQSALARAEREQGQFALLYLDLDNFKQVNDTYGHQAGDELLQQTALRILDCVRQSDTVARFGGDEFVILLQQVDNDTVALKLAEKVRQALHQPFNCAGQALQVLPSIGVSLFPQHSKSANQLLQRADNAMYLAKKSGGNKVVLSPDAL
jgi:diguanylate cyclase (GGDEF)-like protein/PAS domain S-box-containing protein